MTTTFLPVDGSEASKPYRILFNPLSDPTLSENDGNETGGEATLAKIEIQALQTSSTSLQEPYYSWLQKNVLPKLVTWSSGTRCCIKLHLPEY